jgi:hypothetical protein
MPTSLNEHCFTEAHWRVIASGFQTEDWFNDGQAVGTGGILNPQPTHLRTGQYYYRFASSSSSREAQSGGGWWIDFENFRTIRSFAEKHGYSIREAARLMLALPYAWTRVDLLIRALLKEPLKAYIGEGKPALGEKKAAPVRELCGSQPNTSRFGSSTYRGYTQRVAVRTRNSSNRYSRGRPKSHRSKGRLQLDTRLINPLPLTPRNTHKKSA